MSGAARPRLAPLPPRALALLRAEQAPPRLVAHLRLVHDVAARLLGWVGRHHPGVPVDAEAVLFGAAVHDIGKTVHPGELSGPGHAHEEAGEALLLARGVPPGLARFCRTHARFAEPDRTLEDLLVSLSDKAWKARRCADLEDRVCARLAAAGTAPLWQVWSGLDEELDAVGAGAEERLAYQARHPLHG
ncbi:HD domain-containing protein [Murinocardiopsis flavida]|uniref:HD domain-containing protein n=1 Tax=Murinocardiopsis flavida TaxID=645275 RepID=A0A2P8DNX6_9ACTN|nr:HD domain-containing protein [Murinocardiopsis flavida]PSK98927.1 HD domain-containing protein [Murinocardiopsis flavida]